MDRLPADTSPGALTVGTAMLPARPIRYAFAQDSKSLQVARVTGRPASASA